MILKLAGCARRPGVLLRRTARLVTTARAPSRRTLATSAVLRSRSLALLRPAGGADTSKAWHRHHTSHHEAHFAGAAVGKGSRTHWGAYAFTAFGVLGWLILAMTLDRIDDMFRALQFLDLAFPRKWLVLRRCFELLPPHDKMRFVEDFRCLQQDGYQDSMFEWLAEAHPEVMQATGLSVGETLQHMQHLEHVVYELEKSDGDTSAFNNFYERVGGQHHWTQAQRLDEMIKGSKDHILDSWGRPIYPSFDALYAKMSPTRPVAIASHAGPAPPQSRWASGLAAVFGR